MYCKTTKFKLAGVFWITFLDCPKYLRHFRASRGVKQGSCEGWKIVVQYMGMCTAEAAAVRTQRQFYWKGMTV